MELTKDQLLILGPIAVIIAWKAAEYFFKKFLTGIEESKDADQNFNLTLKLLERDFASMKNTIDGLAGFKDEWSVLKSNLSLAITEIQSLKSIASQMTTLENKSNAAFLRIDELKQDVKMLRERTHELASNVQGVKLALEVLNHKVINGPPMAWHKEKKEGES